MAGNQISCSCGAEFEPDMPFVESIDDGEICFGVVCKDCDVAHFLYAKIEDFVEGDQ